MGLTGFASNPFNPFNPFNPLNPLSVVVVAQVVRAPDCGSGGCGFKSRQPPSNCRVLGTGCEAKRTQYPVRVTQYRVVLGP
jgi:hypothetical protein